jgi:hypothetical protein
MTTRITKKQLESRVAELEATLEKARTEYKKLIVAHKATKVRLDNAIAMVKRGELRLFVNGKLQPLKKKAA